MNSARHTQCKLAYFAAIEVENRLWVSHLRFNGLFSIDMKTGKIEYRGKFLNSKDTLIGLHAFVKKYYDKLVFFPQLGRNIDIYDMKTGVLESYPINAWIHSKVPISAIGAILDGDSYWIFPRQPNMPVVKFSLTLKKVCDYFYLEKSNQLIDEKYKVISVEFLEIDRKAYFPIYGTCFLVCVDIIKKVEEIYRINNTNGLQAIGYDGENIWLADSTDVIKWNKEVGELVRFSHINSEITNLKQFVTQFLFNEDFVYIVPVFHNWVKRIDKITGELYTYHISNDLKIVDDNIKLWRRFKNAIIRENELVIYPVSFSGEVHINLVTENVAIKEYLIEKKFFPPVKVDSTVQHMEYKEFDLNELILTVKNNAYMDTKFLDKEMDTYGERIYRILES